MADNEKEPITIKKYANRRLYNTGTSTYVTLEDLATMVKAGEDFVVYDAKSGDDITRSVLAQIIFEQENKEGQSLLPITFLRQLIRFYGDSMQAVVPRFLEFSLESLMRDQDNMRKQLMGSFGSEPFHMLEEQTKRNVAMFQKAMSSFNPFAMATEAARSGQAASAPTPEPRESSKSNEGASQADLDNLRKQLQSMQNRLDELAGGKK